MESDKAQTDVKDKHMNEVLLKLKLFYLSFFPIN